MLFPRLYRQKKETKEIYKTNPEEKRSILHRETSAAHRAMEKSRYPALIILSNLFHGCSHECIHDRDIGRAAATICRHLHLPLCIIKSIASRIDCVPFEGREKGLALICVLNHRQNV